jgi:hypothetical protein
LIRDASRAKLRAMRSLVMVAILVVAKIAAADPAPAATVEAEPPTGIYEPPPKHDPPRWRVRGLVATGAGVAIGGTRYVTFPTSLELGARIWGPLSVSLSGAAILASREVTSCGLPSRPNAGIGGVGLRADLANGRSASWVSPFVEVHAGVGGQAAFAEAADPCAGPRVFATGGGRIGVDAWLGRVAITAQVGYDYLPIGAPLSISLGASVVLY